MQTELYSRDGFKILGWYSNSNISAVWVGDRGMQFMSYWFAGQMWYKQVI